VITERKKRACDVASLCSRLGVRKAGHCSLSVHASRQAVPRFPLTQHPIGPSVADGTVPKIVLNVRAVEVVDGRQSANLNASPRDDAELTACDPAPDNSARGPARTLPNPAGSLPAVCDSTASRLGAID